MKNISFTPFTVYWVEKEFRFSILSFMLDGFRSLVDFSFESKDHILIHLLYHFNFQWSYNKTTNKYEW